VQSNQVEKFGHGMPVFGETAPRGAGPPHPWGF